MFFNSLPNDKNLELSNKKACADDKIYGTQVRKNVLYRTENIFGKGENADNQHFLLCPQCFQKLSFFLSILNRQSVLRMYLKVIKGWLMGIVFPISQTIPCFTRLQYKSFEKKKKNFYLSHTVFFSFRETSTIFMKLKFVVCKLFEFGRV